MPLFSIVVILTAVWPAAAPPGDMAWQSLSEATEEAQREQKPVLVYVHAAWCGPCLKMEKEVFPSVTPLLERFVLAGLNYDDTESTLRAYGIARSPFNWALTLGASATPSFIVLGPDGAVITRTTGFVDTEGFSLLLAYVATNAYHHATFEEYVATVQH